MSEATKHVFLTGATGTIGSELLPLFLGETDTRLTVLIRAPDADALQARVRELLAYCGIDPADARAARLQALRGDISEQDFGLDVPTLTALGQRLTHIVHCAASVKLNLSMEEARASAVVPTRQILSLARAAAEAGHLQKVDMVSTVGVWGCEPGTMPEQPLPEVEHFHNTYEAAKAEAERVLWADGGGLPITVHRPSMVVGNAANGRVIHFQVFYHLCEFLSGARTRGVMPDLAGATLDTIPVDYVARAIHWCSGRPETAGRILHLCSGPGEAVALLDLQRQVRRMWQDAGIPVPSLKRVSRHLIAALVPVVGAFLPDRQRRALRALPPVLAYLAERQAFGNTRSRRELEDAGIPFPSPAGYLEAVLRFYLQAKYAPSP